MVWNERSLRRTLQSYFAYYQRSENTFGASQGRSRVESSGENQNAGASWRFLRSEDLTIATSARLLSDSSSVLGDYGFQISCLGLANQSRLFVSQNQISSRLRTPLCTPRFCDSRHLASLLQCSLDQLLRQRVITCGRGFR